MMEKKGRIKLNASPGVTPGGGLKRMVVMYGIAVPVLPPGSHPGAD